MHLRGIHLVTDNLEDSANFYAQTLGLKEIERESDIVALQGKDISGLLLFLKDADVDEGLDHISFTVENLDNIVQKLEDADVDVRLKNYDDGTRVAHFEGPENVTIGLATADLLDTSGGEETEIRIYRFVLKTDDVEDSIQFYTQVLGLKEIEGFSYEDNEDYVGLQAGNIIIVLLSTGWFESEGFDRIDFEVDNLYNTVQKLEAADVDVDLGEVNEHGWCWGFFGGPDNVKIGLVGLEQTILDEETDSQDGNTERPSIVEKVRFWEEQDRINQELIPRVIRQNELLTQHIAEHDNLQQILSDTMQKALSEQAQQYESALDTAQKQLNETHEQITQKALSEQVENLRQEARQTRNRLTAIAAGSAIIAITALIVAVLA
ncbi:MAG: hypothetical protein F4Y39_17445 [Gemmatimonadetes bacterium]|nr:hypothetical protein [Gemmatimonadota bacterium]MYK52460.1 hypothetical protein [Gemmatimonadota bacterium]